MATPIFPPTQTTNILVNTRTLPKIVYLPAVSTVGAGKLLCIKDICGNAGVSSIFLSTTGLDSFDYRFRPSTLYAQMSTNFQSVLLVADGVSNWLILQNYNTNVLPRFQNIATTFSFTGANQTFTVPSTITQIRVYMWGAGGGGGGRDAAQTGGGGAGAMVQGVLTVTPGEALTVVVGGGGSTGSLAFGGGGRGAVVGGGTSGGGGGRSALRRSTADVVVAGGGGGGSYNTTQGGSATFSGTANDGSGGATGGKGGTQAAGGAAGVGGVFGSAATAGSLGQGGSCSGFGGGGGGGWYGGGGGSSDIGAGGGGGSSLVSNLSLIPSESVLGYTSSDGKSAPNTSSPYYTGTIAAGGNKSASGDAGGNGLVVIVY